MNKNCSYCSEIKTIYQYEKMVIENKYLSSIMEKNNIIIKQDKIISELFDTLKIYISQNEQDKIQNTINSRFDTF